jgi:hypothetical protein
MKTVAFGGKNGTRVVGLREGMGDRTLSPLSIT